MIRARERVAVESEAHAGPMPFVAGRLGGMAAIGSTAHDLQVLVRVGAAGSQRYPVIKLEASRKGRHPPATDAVRVLYPDAQPTCLQRPSRQPWR